MSINSILKRIEDEASAYSEQRLKDAEEERNKILDEANREAGRIKDKRRVASKKEAEQIILRNNSVAGLDSRQMTLQTKQELIKESFDGAVEYIRNLDADDYVNFIEKQVEPFKNQTGEVLISSRDRHRYGARVMEKLEGTKLKLSDEVADIKGGCIIKCGNISYNASIEEIMESDKTNIMREISDLLF